MSVPFGPVVIRASALTGYMDCQRRSAAELFRALITSMGFTLRWRPNGIGGAIGTGVHAGSAYALIEKGKTGLLAPLSATLDAAIASLKESTALGVVYETNGSAEHYGHAELHVRRMTEVYHQFIGPKVNPVIVETRLEAEIAPGVILSGQSDVVAREPSNLRDTKTTTSPGKPHNPQVGGYSMLARTHGIEVTGALIDEIQRVPLSKPQPPPKTTPYDLATVETAATNVIRHIRNDLKVFTEGDPENHVLPGDPWAFPANPSSKLCSDKFCSAWGTDFCREHAIKEAA